MKDAPLKSVFLLLATFIAMQTFGQSSGPKPEIPAGARSQAPLDLGHLDGLNYVNDFFGLSLSIPANWIVVNGQRNKEILDESKKLLENEEARKRTEYEKSIEKSTILLGLTRLPAGTPNNASFIVVAERLSSPAIMNGVAALRAMETMTKKSSFVVEFQDGIRSETINGVEFGVATVKTTSGGTSVMQKIYMMVKKGYGLEFFFTYDDAARLPAFNSIMKTVKIK